MFEDMLKKNYELVAAGGQKGARVVTTTARLLILQPDSTFCEETIQAIPNDHWESPNER